MYSNRYLTTIFFLLFFGQTAILFAEMELLVGVNRSNVYEGESLVYQVVLVNSQPIPDSVAPDLSEFNELFHVKLLSKQTRVLNMSTFSTVLDYELTPKKSGDLAIPAPKVIVDGKKIFVSTVQIGKEMLRAAGNGSIPIKIQAPESQDIALIEIQTDRQRLYPLQTLTISLIVRVKALPEDLTRQDPLSVLGEPPKLTIPWVNDQTLPKGIIPQKNLNDWISGFLTKRGQRGFAINEIESRGLGFDDDFFSDPFSARRSLFERRLLQFRPTPKKVRHPDAEGKETTYWEYRFDRIFQAEEFGSCSFGPVVLKGGFPVPDASARQGASVRSIYAVAQPVSVQIVDVPENNRPKTYIGAFGKFDWNVDIQPRKAKIGDPMTATLRLSGKGSTVNVKAIDIGEIPTISENFKTYFPPTEESDENSCTFTYTLRPQKAGRIVFPAIPVSFFDVESEQFVDRQNEPISLEIEEALTLKNVPSPSGVVRSFSGQMERSEKGLFANMTDPSRASDQSVNYVRLFYFVLASIGGYVFIAILTLLWRYRNSNPKRKRQSGALPRAKNRLSELKQQAKASNSSTEGMVQRCDSLRSILCGYIADKTDCAEQGMTSKDACEKFSGTVASQEKIDELRRILETLDETRYGGIDLLSMDQLITATEQFLQRL